MAADALQPGAATVMVCDAKVGPTGSSVARQIHPSAYPPAASGGRGSSVAATVLECSPSTVTCTAVPEGTLAKPHTTAEAGPAWSTA